MSPIKRKQNPMKIAPILATLALVITASITYKVMFPPTPIAQNSNTLIIGTATGYAPWVSINPAGEYEGFDVDVAHAIANHMGKKLVIKDLGSMATLFTALNQGSIDAIIWGISITKDRLEKVAMIRYHGDTVTSLPLLFWENAPTNISSFADLAGKTVCVEPASSEEAALRPYPQINLLQTEKVDDALLTIQYGKADCALVEPAIAQKFKNKYPEIKVVSLPLDPKDYVHGVGIVTQKDNAPLIHQLQNTVTDLQKTGVITTLEQKWNMIP